MSEKTVSKKTIVKKVSEKPSKKIVVKKVVEKPVSSKQVSHEVAPQEVVPQEAVPPKKIGRPRKEKVLIPKDQKKSNPWVDHVKSYAAENHTSYMNALKDPMCKSSYQSSKK